jgi:hypothetical protein
MKHRDVVRRSRPPVPLTRARVEGTLRRVRARLRQGQQSQEIIALSATGQLGMAATGQIQLTVVTRHAREDPHIPQPQEAGAAAQLVWLPGCALLH